MTTRTSLVALLVVASSALAQIERVEDLTLSGARGTGRLANDAYAPAIAVNDAGVVAVVWVDTRRGEEDLFAMTLVPGSDAGAVIKALVTDPGSQTNPALAAQLDGRFTLAWQETKSGQTLLHVGRLTTSLGVSDEAVQASGRAPSLFTEGDGTVWLAWQQMASSTPGASSELRVQRAEDLLTGATGIPFVVPFDGGTVVRTALAAAGTQSVVAAETSSELFVFNKGLPLPLRADLGTSARFEQPAVAVGALPEEAWVAFDVVGSQRQVEVLHYQGATLIDGNTLQSHTSPAFFMHKGVFTLAAFNDLGVLELHDVINNQPITTLTNLPGATKPAWLVSTGGNPLYFAWQEGQSPRLSISAAKVTSNGAVYLQSDVSPTTVLVQRNVHVSFNPTPVMGALRGVVVWQLGSDTVQLAWLTHPVGSSSLTASAPIPLFNVITGGEVVDLDTAMGAQGALVVVLVKTGTSTAQQPFWVRRDGASTPMPSVSGEGGPVVSFGNSVFDVLWGAPASNLMLAEYADGSLLPRNPMDVSVRATAYDLDCLPAPFFACALVVERAGGGTGWMFGDESNLRAIDMTNGATGPVAVTHDLGGRFALVWRHAMQSRLVFGSAAPGDAQLRLDADLSLPGTTPLALRLAPGNPPWLVMSEAAGELNMARVEPNAQLSSVAVGRGPDLTSLGDEELAVVGFTAFDSLSSSMLPHVLLVRARTDAGVDGGSGSVDAGLGSDGGVDGGMPGDGGDGPEAVDGGTAKFNLQSCGCDAGGGSFLALALLGLLRLRRTAR